MMLFPSMLINAAQKAGMAVPPNPEAFDAEAFPHFHVFCLLQLGRPVSWGEHWENAKIIAAIPVENLETMTLEDFISKGLTFRS